MPRHKIDWSSVVLLLTLGAYAPLAIGGWQHPKEMNIAVYSLWVILSVMMTYSTKGQGFAGWKMPLGWVLGNVFMVVFALLRGGYTFNLGPAETVALYGIVTTLAVWVAVGVTKKKWSHRILLLGSIAADVASFYPQLKQYLLPHEPPTTWMILGWYMFFLVTFTNMVFVDELFKKLRHDSSDYEKIYEKTKSSFGIVEESLLSIENCALILVTVLVMTR